MSGGGHGGGGLPGLHAIEHWIHASWDNGGTAITARAIIIGMVTAIVGFFIMSPAQSLRNFELLFFISPVWMPLVLAKFAWVRWLQSRRRMFNAKQNYVLLEIRMPRDTRKSPLSMETIFSVLHLGPGESNWYKKYWNGGVRPWWSFEIVSLGGRVHFYVWTREVYRRTIETAFYSHYPGVEIVEATDYSLLTDPAHAPMKGFACEFVHTKDEDVYPIKTYVDYGLDKQPMPKPEEVTDPMAHIIETLGSIGPKEQLWLQFIIRVSKGEKYGGKVNAAGKPFTWKDEAKEQIEKIRAGAVRKQKRVDPVTGATIETDGFPNPTKGEQELINAIERNVSKVPFDVGIRAIYMGEGDAFHGSMPGSLGNIFKPFNSETGNGLKWTRWSIAFNDYPWEDPHGHHHEHAIHSVTDYYRRRAYFHEPYIGPWIVMSSEELASIYHVPSKSVTTPTLPRIQSATGEAPSNLPV